MKGRTQNGRIKLTKNEHLAIQVDHLLQENQRLKVKVKDQEREIQALHARIHNQDENQIRLWGDLRDARLALSTRTRGR